MRETFNIFKKHERSIALNSGGLSPFFVSSGGKVIASQTVTPSLALTNSDIYAVVSRIASNIAAMDFQTNSPAVNEAIKKPSSMINGFSFWQKVVVQLLLTGNSYVMIKRNAQQEPTGFIQIPANSVQINILSKSAGDGVDGIVYTVTVEEENAKTYTVDSKDMLHFRCLVSGADAETNGYCGISPLVSLAQEAAIQDRSNKLANAALSNAIAPSYLIKIPQNQIENAKKERFRQAIEHMSSGANAGRAIVLDESMDIQPLAVNPNIDKLLSNSKFSQTQIAKAFGIPAEYLNGQGDQQSSIEMMKSLYVNGLAPYVKALTSEMEAKLGVTVWADFSVSSDVDHQQLISNIVSLSAGKSPVLPPRTAVQLLKNAHALGLDQISNDDLTAQFNAAATSPPQNTNGGGEK